MNFSIPFLQKISPKLAFYILAFFVFLFMMLISNDYGITNDEPIHSVHGKVILDYFQGTTKTASLSPIDSAGKLIQTFDAIENDKIQGMNFFGGFFDLSVSYLHQFFPKSDFYEFRHRINSIFGFLIFLFIALIVKALSNWKVAIFGFVIAIATPQLFGHAFNNPKDIPFAAFYTIALYLIIRICQNLPKYSIKYAALLIVVIALSIDVRVSGLLLIFYLYAALFFVWINNFKAKIGLKLWLFSGIKYFIFASIIGILAYFSSIVLWPYAHTNFLAPLEILTKVSKFEVFNAYELFNYQWYNPNDLPRTYSLVWIYISNPLIILLGAFLSSLLFFKKINSEINKPMLLLLWLSVLFPVVYIIYKHSYLYNGIRHLLFIFPILAVLATLGIYFMHQKLQKSIFKIVFIALVFIGIADPFYFYFKNHPFESMYFNRVDGGTSAAFKRFELDYWGISAKRAAEWIANDSKKIRETELVYVRMFYGDSIKLENELNKYSNLKFIISTSRLKWNYDIVYPAQGKFDPKILENWPPAGTVHQIFVDSAPMCAIVKYDGRLIAPENNLAAKLKENLTEDQCVSLSIEFYSLGDYINCIWACNKTLGINPNSSIAYNNMGSALNALGMYDAAKVNLETSLKIQPNFQLAQNNLAVAKQELAKPISVEKLVLATYYAYQLGDFQRCINYSKLIISKEPKNAIAYNNMGSAYNALGKFKLGAEACKMSLKLDPSSELAKNNLAYALQNLNK